MLKKLILAVSALSLICLAGCDYGERLEFQGNDLYYTEAVTEAEAQKLGEKLVGMGFFDDSRKRSVQLNKTEDEIQFRMVVVDNYKEMTGVYPHAFQALATYLAHTVFEGQTVKVHLTDPYFKTLEVVESPLARTKSVEKQAAEKQSAEN